MQHDEEVRKVVSPLEARGTPCRQREGPHRTNSTHSEKTARAAASRKPPEQREGRHENPHRSGCEMPVRKLADPRQKAGHSFPPSATESGAPQRGQPSTGVRPSRVPGKAIKTKGWEKALVGDEHTNPRENRQHEPKPDT